MLIPDSAHGTNPASTAIAGYSVVQLKSDDNGEVDLADLERHLDESVAAFMITQPNTLGLFESRIHQITEMCHAKGVQVYMDGANFNAILGITRPGDLGFDVCHFNLHKTFTTPHGGGGPGAGPVGVKAHLAPFLPTPVVVQDGRRRLCARRRCGRSPSASSRRSGATSACSSAPTRTSARIGPDGLRARLRQAVLNANYILKRLEGDYDRADAGAVHARVRAVGARQKKLGREHHGHRQAAARLRRSTRPTIYFPLIVEEALMIEPTETESKETLDAVLRRHDPDRAGGGVGSAYRPRRPGDDAGAPARPDAGRAAAPASLDAVVTTG